MGAGATGPLEAPGGLRGTGGERGAWCLAGRGHGTGHGDRGSDASAAPHHSEELRGGDV